MQSEGPQFPHEFVTIGDFLRELREKQNVDLKTIAFKTKINFTILKELESNNYKRIPDKTYVRGFVKSYAKEIGADLEETMEFLERTYNFLEKGELEAGLSTPQELHHPVKESEAEDSYDVTHNEDHLSSIPNREKLATTITSVTLAEATEAITGSPLKKVLPLVTFILILVTGGVILVKQLQPKNDLESTVDLGKPEIISSTASTEMNSETTESEAPQVESKAEQVNVAANTTPEPAASVVVASTPTPRPTPTKEQEQKAKEITFKEIELPLYKLVPNAPEVSNTDLLPKHIKAAMVKDLQNIFINAVEGDSWITYKIDNQEIKSFVLRKGRTLFLKGKEIIFFLGNVNSAKIFYNNQLVQAESSSGVKSFVFPESSATKYELPLFVYEDNGQIFTAKEYKEKHSL